MKTNHRIKPKFQFTPASDFAKGDPDFEHFLAHLVAQPRLGYGPVEAVLNDHGKIASFSFGPVNDNPADE
jgi:hypothetical protein